ncbi:TonB-dependent receptor [Novosphingobium sp. KA1]|uniref:TonB-dependent receptor plug domain-containing protein n=1 Tax=Novosphingobium sp. (strain KA1) TaxID=164608 RepID=UPI001A8EEAFA|nr:TonB-dependent receptor [Novosphingobium sp. KA1]QSR19672.1 hypothetical protein CA833_21225 [Novosphingobium sp. KA1]
MTTCIPVAAAAKPTDFRVVPGRLGDVAAALGVQARVTVAVSDPEVAMRPSPGVTGPHSLPDAVSRILRGTGARAVFHDERTISIVADRTRPAASLPPRAAVTVSVPPPETVGEDIVVAASKQRVTIDRYPGSVKVIGLSPSWTAANGFQGTSALTALQPTLSATDLGPGRNKLFIRGIADSSFSGQTQATVGEYLGNVRLNYNAPDPDLNLYDISRMEVLVGPQGALYGAGSLGGIVRLVANTPDPERFAVTTAANIGVTQNGGISRDGAGMLNIPLADGVAARVVVYGGYSAGYIDAPDQGRRDINGSRRYGQRFSLRSGDLSGWTLDLGFIFQNISGSDGQYTIKGEPALTRSGMTAQPFENNYRLGYVSAQRAIGSLELNTTTSLSLHQLATTYDATGYDQSDAPASYDEHNIILLFSHETRVSGGSAAKPWVAGVSAVVNSSYISRDFTTSDGPYDIPGVVNQQTEVAVFGQASRPLGQTLTGTLGGRLTYSATKGFLTGDAFEDLPASRRRAVRFSGTFAIDWRPGGPVSGFFHYQQGYRPGGLGYGLSETGIAAQRYDADDLHMNELGIRIGDARNDKLTARAAVFIALWRNIQADLIGSSGFSYTANIGNGSIHGLDGEVNWRPRPSLSFSLAAFLNDSKVGKLRSGIVPSTSPEVLDISRTLPDVARSGVHFSGEWNGRLSDRITATARGSLRYVGRSQLGIGYPLDVSQGDYAVADMSLQLQRRNLGLTLSLDNVANTRANTFAFGNPFGLWQRNQMTPLRPRTLRLGLQANW